MVCKPKNAGGLGIKKAQFMNQAMLAKASWRIIHNDDGLWFSVLKHKYLKKRSLLAHNYKCPSGSSSIGRSFVFGAQTWELSGVLGMTLLLIFGLISGSMRVF